MSTAATLRAHAHERVYFGACRGKTLLPVQLRVATRDDPTQDWASNALQQGMVPVYAGQACGDMVSWKIADTDSWSNTTFTWSVTGTDGSAVTDENGATITGPSGVGVNEWRIATWAAGGNDPHNQWLDWRPGIYNISCTISTSGGGTSKSTFQQEVGQRTKDVVVIGWINPAGVPVTADGVDSDVLTFFPTTGSPSSTAQKVLTASYLGTISLGSTVRPIVAAPLSISDKVYILEWMFKYGGNSAPPNSFADEATLETFDNTPTNYKLFNRLQIKYRINGSQFASPGAVITMSGTTNRNDIGATIDPVLGQQWPGQKGPANLSGTTTANTTYHQINDGSPDSWAVSAFNTLMYSLKWNDIGSRIDEGVPLDQGTPPITGYTVETQVYPTYYIYERASDNGFYLMEVIPQAATPVGNFNLDPYPPNPHAPFLLPP
jgi:hypothetical protein